MPPDAAELECAPLPIGRGLPSRSGMLALASMGLVVLLVSLPQLRALGLHENEGDAARVARVLGEALSRRSAPPAAIHALVEAEPALARQLTDAEWLEAGGVLRCHGYLFDLATEQGRTGLRAWPWAHGRTGRTVFVWVRGRGLVSHANDAARWSGPGAGPAVPPEGEAGWSALSTSSTGAPAEPDAPVGR